MPVRSPIGEKRDKTVSTPWVLTNEATQRLLERVL